MVTRTEPIDAPPPALPQDTALLLLTRFNAPLPWLRRPPPDAAWLAHRCQLFETFCLPTVAAQTFPEFRWIVYFDARTPASVRARIDSYQRRCPQMEPCFVEALDNSAVARDIQASVGDPIRVVVTVRLDNDDAISRRYLARFVEAVRPEEPERRFINMRLGYSWKEERTFLRDHPSSPFFATVERREDLKTGLAFDHTRIAEAGAVEQIEDGRHYIQVLHSRNVSNSLRGRPREVPPRSLRPEFPLEALDIPQNWLRRVAWNGMGVLGAARRAVRQALGRRRP